MRASRPHLSRVHGAVPLVVVLLAAGMLCLTQPAAALGIPVDPVPAGVWPLQPEPEVVRGFEPPSSTYGPGHRGVDLAGFVGEPVVAALGGRISFAGRLAGRGVVVVDHGTTRTTYEPVVGLVAVGQVVARGQRIGVLELTASHCLPAACLHWGWRRGDTYLDPLLLVGGGPIRLLPVAGPTPLGGGGPLDTGLPEASPFRPWWLIGPAGPR